MNGEQESESRDKTIFEACFGTGRLLLNASNHSLRLHGQEINLIFCKCALVNALGHRAVYSLNIHLVLVTKYRRKIINQAMLKRLQEIFESTCAKWRSKVTEYNAESDHVHLVISYPPDVEVSKLVNNLKTVSSRLIRKEFNEHVNRFYNKPVFWTGAYFVASCGGVTLEQLKSYVEKQSSPDN